MITAGDGVLLSVKQDFVPDEKLLSLMETFRRMVNDCIHIGLEENRTSMKSLSLACYSKLKPYYVNARTTSSKCAVCNDKLFVEERRTMRCRTCGRVVDRDENATVNIAKRGLEKLFSMRFSPSGQQSEAMVQECQTETNPESRLLADNPKLIEVRA